MKKALNNKKGFTLIEIIVVLVILAILAAVAIPSMIGFVEDARGKAYASDARVGLSAAQAVVTELVVSGAHTVSDTNLGSTVLGHETFKRMTAEVGEANNWSDLRIDTGNARVTGITLTKNNYKIVIGDNTTTVTKL